MFFQSWLAIATAAVFYLIIPLIGALVVREKWRGFRSLLFQAALLPRLRPETVFRAMVQAPDTLKACEADSQVLGLFTAYGAIDAIGPEHRLWLRLDGATCSVLMTGVQVYTLAGVRAADAPSLDPEIDTVECLRWRAIPSIPQGARLFVSGTLVRCDGTVCFTATPEQNLLVVLHDGLDEYVLPRALIAGRHRNEYWNTFTQISLSLGILLMSILLTGSISSRHPIFVQALNITLAFMPILIFLPPGFIFYFLYRRFWALARRYRAERDIARLHGDSYKQWKRRGRVVFLASLGCFTAGLLVNAVLIFQLLRHFL